MDILEEGLIKFWKTLNENGVRYMMVGPFATRFHGFNRSTDDLDMWLENTLLKCSIYLLFTEMWIRLLNIFHGYTGRYVLYDLLNSDPSASDCRLP